MESCQLCAGGVYDKIQYNNGVFLSFSAISRRGLVSVSSCGRWCRLSSNMDDSFWIDKEESRVSGLNEVCWFGLLSGLVYGFGFKCYSVR